jgi:hypothetical protein
MNPMALHLASATGISEKDFEASVLVYPNPVYDELQIVSEAMINSVTISGISGNCVKMLSNISEYNLLLSTKNLVPGMYMLKVETSKGIVIRKLIKSNNR